MVIARALSNSELEILRKLQDFIKSAHHNSGRSDFAHILSVAKNSILIGQEITDEVDPFILIAGALLHDIGKTQKEFSHIHGLFGGSLAEEFLMGHNVPEDITNAICRVVIRHTGSSMISPETPEERIVSDADSLDRIGLIGLLRAFIGRSGSMTEILSKFLDSEEVAYEELHYSESKKLGKEKNEEMLRYIHTFKERLEIRLKSIDDVIGTFIDKNKKF